MFPVRGKNSGVLVRKIIYAFVGISLFFGTAAAASADMEALAPHAESYAYKQYQLRPKSELSKIYYLMDRYQGSKFKVIYDGAEYDSGKALSYAKSYVKKHYKKEEAREWVKMHSTRSASGRAIYLKSPDGKTTLLRDELMKELDAIES